MFFFLLIPCILLNCIFILYFGILSFRCEKFFWVEEFGKIVCSIKKSWASPNDSSKRIKCETVCWPQELCIWFVLVFGHKFICYFLLVMLSGAKMLCILFTSLFDTRPFFRSFSLTKNRYVQAFTFMFKSVDQFWLYFSIVLNDYVWWFICVYLLVCFR